MKKKQLRKSDIRSLNESIEKLYGISDFFSKKDAVEHGSDGFEIILKDDVPLFFYKGDDLIPTLKLLLKKDMLKKVTVDMGAVKFVTSGADIMRPGITQLQEDIIKDEHVAVVDENNQKPLAVAAAMFSGEEMISMDKGKVLKNIHHVGDDLWNLG